MSQQRFGVLGNVLVVKLQAVLHGVLGKHLHKQQTAIICLLIVIFKTGTQQQPSFIKILFNLYRYHLCSYFSNHSSISTSPFRYCAIIAFPVLLIIITNISGQILSMQQIQIKEQLSKFINLLQSDYKPASSPSEDRRSEYPLSKKLSIILSASQPQSSSLDKENSNPSANRSFETNEKAQEGNCQSLFQSLFDTQLTASQTKLLQKLKESYQQMRSQLNHHQSRFQSLRKDLSAEKRANDEMLAVLMKLDLQEKQLWENYNIVSAKYQEVTERMKETEEECFTLKNSLLALQNDNDFMKKLIFHANQNYEALQRRCQDLEVLRQRSQANTDRKNVKKSSIDNLLKSAKTRKNGQSPAHSEIQHSPSVDDFQEIYRKMIVRTLKFKGRQQQFR